MQRPLFFILLIPILFLSSCYSFHGAAIEGKTLFIAQIENRALNIVPSLLPMMNEKIRGRLISQTGLAVVNDEDADYNIKAFISAYQVGISGVQGNTGGVAQNRLSITINVDFKNKLNPKSNFKQAFTRFRDFDGNVQIQSVEARLIEAIAEELADDIFNKAFVNW